MIEATTQVNDEKISAAVKMNDEKISSVVKAVEAKIDGFVYSIILMESIYLFHSSASLLLC